MVAFDGSEPCGRAEPYYHDFLDDESRRAVPQAIRDHIQRCAHCQRRLDRLREVLRAAAASPSSLQPQRDSCLVAELQSHYELLGEPVTCERVKRFLPSLLVPSVKIRIPTPVTVHVDQCPACAKDLESLRGLGLDSGQLARLGRLYADSSIHGLWACLRTQSRISIVWPGSMERVDTEILDHLCVCPRCRNRVYQQRKRLLERRSSDSSEEGALCCVDISPAEVFDFVVPYGGVDGSGESSWSWKCRAHLRSCPDCLKKAQQLHRTVYGIAERADSGVVTVCTTVPDGQGPAEETEPLYEGYPIDVQVLERERLGTASRHRVAARLRPAFKPVLMAAALIPLAIVFFLSPPPASGLNPAQVDRILFDAPGVHVSAFGDDLATLKWTSWASQSEGLLVSKTAEGVKVCDFAQGRGWQAGGVGGVVPIDTADFADAERHMDGLLGLSLDELLWETELKRLADLTEAGTRLEVYQLQWQISGYGGPSWSRQWKVYVDPETRRPLRTELFTWDRQEKAWALGEIRRFEYLDEGAVRRRADALLPLE